jgi:hypothetical protein
MAGLDPAIQERTALDGRLKAAHGEEFNSSAD